MKDMCQSCGMPMQGKIELHGTNKNGSKSSEYCVKCFSKGKITDNFKSAKEMQVFVKKILKEQNIGKFRSWLFTLVIPILNRWR